MILAFALALALQDFIDLKLAPKALILVVHDGKTTFAATPGVNERSLVRVGSISKVMAGEVLAQLVTGGTLDLHAKVPNGSHPVTYFQLATHTSGAPRNGSADGNWPPPGKVAQYSNVAFWLLGDAMATATQQPYPKLLAKHITAPLKLRDTTSTPNAEQCGRLITGACTDESKVASTAGVYSTPHDMGLWLKHLMSHPSLAHKRQVERSSLERVEGLDMAGHAEAIGFGWIHHKGTLEKTGGYEGFLTYIAFTPNGRTGVFAAITTMDLEQSARMAAWVNRYIAELNSK